MDELHHCQERPICRNKGLHLSCQAQDLALQPHLQAPLCVPGYLQALPGASLTTGPSASALGILYKYRAPDKGDRAWEGRDWHSRPESTLQGRIKGHLGKTGKRSPTYRSRRTLTKDLTERLLKSGKTDWLLLQSLFLSQVPLWTMSHKGKLAPSGMGEGRKGRISGLATQHPGRNANWVAECLSFRMN